MTSPKHLIIIALVVGFGILLFGAGIWTGMTSSFLSQFPTHEAQELGETTTGEYVEGGFRTVVYDNGKNEIRIEDSVLQAPGVSSLLLLEKLPYVSDVEILEPLTSSDGRYMFFTLAYSLQHPVSVRGGWHRSTYAVAYRYDIRNNKTEAFLTSGDIGATYPMIEAVSPDNRYVAYRLHSCWYCDTGYVGMIIADVSGDISSPLANPGTFITARLGPVFDFTFTSTTTYQYAEGVYREDADLPGYYPGPIRIGEL